MPRASQQENRETKATRLIQENRCHALATVPGKVWFGVVIGDTGRYLVADVDGDAISDLHLGTGVIPPRSVCQCKAFTQSGGCAHTRAAMKLRIQSEPVDDLFRRLALTRFPQPKDTPQQKAILRSSLVARRCRQRFPAGTSITTGKMSGVVKRHVPTGNAQGGHLVVIWDNGVTGRIGPVAVERS